MTDAAASTARAPAARRRRDRRDHGDRDRHLADRAHRGRRGARARARAADVNMGPHHPATHGVLRLLVSLQGEVVLDLKPIDGLRPHRDREELRGQELLEGDPVRRADGLPLLLLQHGGLLRRGRAHAGARDPAARQVPADDPPGAQPDPLAPGLARDVGARPRRDVDALVRVPRARHDPRPVRDVDRPADAHPLLPGRRRLRGHPGRASRRSSARSAPRCPTGSTSTRRCSTATRSSCRGRKGVGIVSRERLLELGVTGPLLRAAGEPWDLRKASPYLAYGEVDFKIPVGTVGDGYDRYRVPRCRRCASR